MKVQATLPRHRWQIDLRPSDEESLALLRDALGVESDTEAGRGLLQFWRRIVDGIRSGYVLSFERAEAATASDAFPEITRALQPESAYNFLVRVAHPWRRQLYLKGRRMTVGQLVAEMEANNWSVEEAADQFDLAPEAVAEALHYAQHHRSLIQAEHREELRRSEQSVTHYAASPR